MSTGKIMNCRFPRPGAHYRLVCFPWAGGGSNFYAGWGKLMTDNVEVFGVTLAGRESRFTDPCTDNLEEILTEITKAIMDNFLDKPLIFWGHSMGGLLAFETASRLKKLTGAQPVKMFLSGVSAPHSPLRKRYNVNMSMPDIAFITFLRLIGGTPDEILNNAEMMKIVLPTLRSDYSLLDNIRYNPPDVPTKFTCPFAFFDGIKDVKHDIEAWKTLTSGHFSLTMMPGGHFYLQDRSNMIKIIETISKEFSDEHEVV